MVLKSITTEAVLKLLIKLFPCDAITISWKVVPEKNGEYELLKEH